MKCPKCDAEISRVAEKCPYCETNLEKYEENEKSEKNEAGFESGKTTGLKVINVIQLIGCIIAAITLWGEEETLLGFICIVSGIVAFIFIKAFSDIIDLLDSINNKLN
jgi:hypothetical protein